ncbi:hypothetical protein KAX17_05510 [Candidatus Bipolaricaulota bacterium]|nr:hypothetical protein [Candidatus Bipolaricaulota bacterium]
MNDSTVIRMAVPGKDGVPHAVERPAGGGIEKPRRGVAEHPALQSFRDQAK